MTDIESSTAPLTRLIYYGGEREPTFEDARVRAFKIALESTWIFFGCALCMWGATLTTQAILDKEFATPPEASLVFGAVMVGVVWVIFFPASLLMIFCMRRHLERRNVEANRAYWEAANMFTRFKYGIGWGFVFYTFLTILFCAFSPLNRD